MILVRDFRQQTVGVRLEAEQPMLIVRDKDFVAAPRERSKDVHVVSIRAAQVPMVFRLRRTSFRVDYLTLL